MSLKLLTNIQDEQALDNFVSIQDAINSNPLVKGAFKFIETTFGTSSSTYPLTTTFTHRLGFRPKDIIQTSVIGGTLTWNYSAFTEATISVTVSAQTTVRFFLGRYEEQGV